MTLALDYVALDDDLTAQECFDLFVGYLRDVVFALRLHPPFVKPKEYTGRGLRDPRRVARKEGSVALCRAALCVLVEAANAPSLTADEVDRLFPLLLTDRRTVPVLGHDAAGAPGRCAVRRTHTGAVTWLHPLFDDAGLWGSAVAVLPCLTVDPGLARSPRGLGSQPLRPAAGPPA